MDYQRARNDAQKQERRQAILAVAWRLFQKMAYADITMAVVAERTGLAKGTVFLYFKTKEELFLAVQERQLGEWFDEVNARLRAMPDKGDAAAVANLLARSLEQRAGLTRLLSILATILEQNVDYDAALRFKRMLLARLSETGGLLEARLPFLSKGEGARVLLRAQALVIGLQHLADPAPVMRRVMKKHVEMHVFEVDFAREFEHTLRALLHGLERESRRKRQPRRQP